MSTITPLPTFELEEIYHAPGEYLQKANRRKTVAIIVLFLLVSGLVAAVVTLALRPPEPYVVAITPNGEEFVLSTPKKKLDLRDSILYRATLDDLNAFSEAYFERAAVTAQRDYEKARWFLPDQLASIYDAQALGPKGWIAQLQNHTLAEYHAIIDAIQLRPEDYSDDRTPHLATCYVHRINIGTGEHIYTIADVYFVYDPDKMAKQTRMPLYNPFGIFIVKPIDERPDFRRQNILKRP